MWIPESADQLEDALGRAELEEHAGLDLKRALPGKGKGLDIATDVAAMANDGGVIVYGVGEDLAGRPATTYPIYGLRAARERIDQVVQHSLSGPPRVHIHLLPVADGADEGYLVVEIPPSPGAPHMVLQRHAFYGRGAAGNRPLEVAEVDRLYARRANWTVDRDRLLDDAVWRLPFSAATIGSPGGIEGIMVLVCRPAAGDPGLLDRLRRQADGEVAGPRATIVPRLQDAQSRCLNRDGWVPNLSSLHDWAPSSGGGFRATTHEPREEIHPKRFLSLQIDGDGTSCLVCGRATDKLDQSGLLVAEGLIAVLCAQACAVTGALLSAGGYAGPVDVALHVDGLRSTVSWRLHGPPDPVPGAERRAYGQPVFRAHRRVAARALADEPIEVAADLVTPLTRVTAGEGWDPMGLVRP